MHKVAIISDTHGSTPEDIYEKLEGVECIFHAGDLGNPDVLLDLEVIAPVHAVCGNIDFFHLSHQLPRKKIVKIGPVSFGLTHGDQFRRSNIQEELIEFFKNDDVNIIIFGHTHTCSVKKHGDLWLVNPGSSNCNYTPTGILLTFEDVSNVNFQLVQFCRTDLSEDDDLEDSFD